MDNQGDKGRCDASAPPLCRPSGGADKSSPAKPPAANAVRAWLVSMTKQGEDRVWRGAEKALTFFDSVTEVVTEANNSLYGSQGFFLSVNGGEPDKYHLALAIEKLKSFVRGHEVVSCQYRVLEQVLVDTLMDRGVERADIIHIFKADPVVVARVAEARASAAGARSDETAQPVQSEGRQSGGAKQRDAQPPTPGGIMTTLNPVAIADVLDAAANLIEPEGAWCQRQFALNAKGQSTGLSEFRGPAVCWCPLGATSKVCDNDGLVAKVDAFLCGFIGTDIDTWNDAPERTQSEVVETLRKAAQSAREHS